MKLKQKKSRKVEIYFILYLTALILLLPNKKSNDFFASKNEKYDFNIQIAKNILNCNLDIDSGGVKLISLDSINTIAFQGEVKNLKYEFIIEDNDNNQEVNLNSSNYKDSKFFIIQENSENGEVQFKWRPSLRLNRNKSYIVKVKCSAQPNGLVDQNKILYARAQFNLNILFKNQIISNTITSIGTSTLLPTQINSPNNTQPTNGTGLINQNIELIPSNENLKTISNAKWQNKITVLGLNPTKELAFYPPLVTVSSDNKEQIGTAYISNILENGIILEGKAPIYSKMKVKVELTRKIDRLVAISEFIVTPTPLSSPSYDRIVYPEMKYIIDPKLPILTNQICTAVLKDNERTIFVSGDGNKFEYTLSIKDTGKTLFLERLIDNQIIGERYNINVKSYPNPEIISIDKQNDGKYIVKTRSFGTSNFERNLVRNLIPSENCQIKEQIGQSSSTNNTHYQKFEISPKNETTNLKIKAIDMRGFESTIKSFGK